MKKTVLSFLLAMVILMSAVACDDGKSDVTTAATTAWITTEDPDTTTTTEPEDDGTTTTEPVPDTTTKPDDDGTTTAKPDDDGTTTAKPDDDGTTTTAPITYTVVWKNHDGTVLETDKGVAAGATPAYPNGTPTKAADAEYTYTFKGWTPEVVTVAGDATYTAEFTATPIEVPATTYTVTWKVEGQEDVTQTYAEGAMPVYPNGTPTKAADGQYIYTFAGWTPAIEAVSGDVTYTATFTAKEIGSGEEEIKTTEHLSVKATFVEGEDIMVTATGSGTDWVYVMDKENADAGLASSHARAYKWWYVTDRGSGVAINLSELLSADKLIAGEYVFRFVPNDGGAGRYTEEIRFTILPA